MDDPSPTLAGRARQALIRYAVMLGVVVGIEALETRRESRGRNPVVVLQTFRALWAIFLVPAITMAVYLAATAIGGALEDTLLFLFLLAPFFVFVATLSAWTVTILSLGLFELISARVER